MKYAAYDKYKASNIGWICDFPAHWELKRLKYVANRAEVKVEADENNPLPYIGLEQVESWSGRLVDLDEDLVPTGVSNHFQAGDTLFGKLRPYLAKACNVDFAGLCSSELLVLRGKNYDRKFLLYQLLSHGFINVVDSSTYGSKMPRVSWDFIGICELSLPPIDEQRTIARFLDVKTAQIDALVAQKHQLIAKLKEKRSALIARTVTRGLPPEAATAAGLEPNPETKNADQIWIGEVPSHWSVKPLKFVAKIKTGFAFSSDDFTDEGIPVVRIGDISREGEVNLSDAKHLPVESIGVYASVQVRNGDILMAMTGATIGKTARYKLNSPVLLNQRVCAFRAMPVFHQGYLWFVLNSDFYVRYVLLIAFGGAQPNISDKQLLDCCVPVPPPREQDKIFSFLEIETSKLENLISQANSAIDRLTEYRQALITSAVTGKIDVRGLT
jgi:type I restriction enzyme S subunit